LDIFDIIVEVVHLETFRRLTSAAFTVLLTLGMIACGGNQKTPEGPRLFASEQYGLEVELPAGWEGSEGPENIMIRETGLAAFNSWGEPVFWARSIVIQHTDGSVESRYSPADVAAQVPAGQAYVALVQISGPPPESDQAPIEYEFGDLSGLVDIHDWRKDGGSEAFFREFYRSEKTLRLEIFCSPTATDKTVAGLNYLLQSWKFR